MKEFRLRQVLARPRPVDRVQEDALPDICDIGVRTPFLMEILPDPHSSPAVPGASVVGTKSGKGQATGLQWVFAYCHRPSPIPGS